jgi:hypothetical protein
MLSDGWWHCPVSPSAALAFATSGIARAAVDDRNRIVSNGLEVVVTQEGTHIRGGPALGGSPLDRESFHNGRGTANLIGDNAAAAENTTFQFGYQFAWVGSVDGGIGVSCSAPGLDLSVEESASATVTDIHPRSISNSN